MKKVLYAIHALSIIFGVVLVPLSPFGVFIIDGEGRVDGMLHEYFVIALLGMYPAVLACAIGGGVVACRRGRVRPAIWIALTPPICAAALAWLFIAGGVQLR